MKMVTKDLARLRRVLALAGYLALREVGVTKHEARQLLAEAGRKG